MQKNTLDWRKIKMVNAPLRIQQIIHLIASIAPSSLPGSANLWTSWKKTYNNRKTGKQTKYTCSLTKTVVIFKSQVKERYDSPSPDDLESRAISSQIQALSGSLVAKSSRSSGRCLLHWRLLAALSIGSLAGCTRCTALRPDNYAAALRQARAQTNQYCNPLPGSPLWVLALVAKSSRSSDRCLLHWRPPCGALDRFLGRVYSTYSLALLWCAVDRAGYSSALRQTRAQTNQYCNPNPGSPLWVLALGTRSSLSCGRWFLPHWRCPQSALGPVVSLAPSADRCLNSSFLPGCCPPSQASLSFTNSK